MDTSTHRRSRQTYTSCSTPRPLCCNSHSSTRTPTEVEIIPAVNTISEDASPPTAAPDVLVTEASSEPTVTYRDGHKAIINTIIIMIMIAMQFPNPRVEKFYA